MSQMNWARNTNNNIQIAERFGRYAYFHQHIEGTMNHVAIRIVRAKTVKGIKYVQALVTGNWAEYRPNEDFIQF
jgi:hypothetical protein